MKRSDYRVLLVEDEEHIIAAVEFVLDGQYELQAARSIADARKFLQSARPDLILLDLGLPDECGINLLRELRKSRNSVDVIMLTGSKDVTTAVESMKLGARDYVQKPFEKEDLLLCVQQAYEHWRLTSEVERLRSELADPFRFEGIVAESPAMKHVIALGKKMAVSQSNVLITGESGTGKELLARAIHWEGARKDGPFVAVNCAQFSGTLLESELFGHEKGSFTGAVDQRKGRFELANGGTLFLDEVGNTSLEMQAKILRVVETREFERVGGTKPLRVDVRLLAATNANLDVEIKSGKFREDLYYRLNVVRIEIAPLRDRKDDIPVLCGHILAKHCSKTGRTMKGITPEAMEALKAYEWRGNVRELQNVIEMAVALEEEEWVTTRYFPTHILTAAAKAQHAPDAAASILDAIVENFERRFIEEQLRIHNWNHRQTARALGVHRNTIENKLRKYSIKEPPTVQDEM